MKCQRRLIVFFAINVCSLPGVLWGALPLSEVLQRMDAQQLAIQDLSFQFVERIKQGDFPEQKISGEVQFKRPHELRVVQKAPQKQILTSDGNTFRLYTPASKQELTGDWQAWVKQSHFPLPLLDWAGSLLPEHGRDQYTVLLGGYQAPLYELHFKPRKSEDSPLTLWVSEQDFRPVRGTLEKDGVSVQVTLQNMKVNTGIEESSFHPRLPPGTASVPVRF